jgi:hypothetical protein
MNAVLVPVWFSVNERNGKHEDYDVETSHALEAVFQKGVVKKVQLPGRDSEVIVFPYKTGRHVERFTTHYRAVGRRLDKKSEAFSFDSLLSC